MIATVGLGACSRSSPAKPTPLPDVTRISIPAAPGAQTPNVQVGRDGTLALTWQEDEDAMPRLRLATRPPGGDLSAPTTLVGAASLLVNWADFPVATTYGDGRLFAAWLQRFEGAEGYGLRFATGAVGDASLGPAAQLHTDTGGPEYGFVSATPRPDGGLALFWLDGRASGGHAGGGAMQLRAATLTADGTITDRRLVDDRVCDCCQTSAATLPRGPVVVYRDRSDTEIRDIAIAGPGLDQRRTVAADGWEIAGCPVNGPAVDTRDDAIVVAWYTGAKDRAAVRVAFGGASGDFGSAIAVDLGAPLGRVDVVWLDDTRALASFVETPEGATTTALLARTVTREGVVGPPWIVADVDASNATGFPRMARQGEHVVWAYTDATADRPTVRLAQAPVAALTK